MHGVFIVHGNYLRGSERSGKAPPASSFLRQRSRRGAEDKSISTNISGSLAAFSKAFNTYGGEMKREERNILKYSSWIKIKKGTSKSRWVCSIFNPLKIEES